MLHRRCRSASNVKRRLRRTKHRFAKFFLLQNPAERKLPSFDYYAVISRCSACLLVKRGETATPTNKQGIIERHAWFTEADRCTCFGLTAPKESVARSVIYLGKIIPDRASRRLLLRLRHGGRRTGLGGRLQFSVAITFLMTRGSVFRIASFERELPRSAERTLSNGARMFRLSEASWNETRSNSNHDRTVLFPFTVSGMEIVLLHFDSV